MPNYAVSRDYIPTETAPEIVILEDGQDDVKRPGTWDIFKSYGMAKKHAKELLEGNVNQLRSQIKKIDKTTTNDIEQRVMADD